MSRRIYGQKEDATEGTLNMNERDTRRWSKDNWTWSAAEDRLSTAFEKGGLAVWAETALRELEAEAEQERSKRGI